MMTRTTTRSVAAAVAVAALLSAAPAFAASPLDETGQDCRAAIAKNMGKLYKTALKTIAGCHKSRNKGEATLAAVNCNNLSVADTKGKYDKAVSKALPAIADACPASLNDIMTSASYDDREWYVSCPFACPDVALNPMVTMADVSDCMGCLGTGVGLDVGDETLGMPVVASLSADDLKCHAAIVKGYSKVVTVGYKESTVCQRDADEVATGDAANEVAGCTEADPKDKVAKALAKAQGGIDKSCAGSTATLAALDSCAATNLTDLKACLDTAWDDAKDDAFTLSFDMPGTICPTTIAQTIFGGCSGTGTTSNADDCERGVSTATSLSVGWTGLAHDIDIVDSYTLAGAVMCPGTFGACGDCTITGLSTDSPQYTAFTRCAEDSSKECDTPFGIDPDCPGLQECSYYLGPPLAISAGGTPTCTYNRVSMDITGTANPDDGTGETTIDLFARVYTGISITQPCPVCQGDTTAQDGVRDGTCKSADPMVQGDPCDVQGFDLNFADPSLGMVDAVAGPSLDCTVNASSNISGLGLHIPLTLGTGTYSNTAADQCDSPHGAFLCWCGACSLDESVACKVDTDCSGGGLGTCQNGTLITAGEIRQPDSCVTTCDDVGDETRGECATGGIAYCDGIASANGTGMISCTMNADCLFTTGSADPQDWTCPDDDCGNCTVVEDISCFIHPTYEVTGTPSTTDPVLAGTFCLPPSSSGSVNTASGSPGPGAVKAASHVTKRY